MRYYDIALFIFIFNLALGFLNAAIGPGSGSLGYTDYGVGELDGFGSDDIATGEERIAQQVNDVYTPIWSELNWLVENVRLVVQGVGTFIVTLSKATILFPVLWYELSYAYVGNSAIFGLFITFISAPFYFVYFMAILQWATGRSVRDTQ